jgi:ketosteroid isomerase-like protein
MFIADDAIFFGGAEPLRGKQRVVDGWKVFFDGPDAPFSWEPLVVEVLDSGTLALSSGPVLNPSGETVAQFTSIWRLEPDGRWRVIFDKGCDVCSRP